MGEPDSSPAEITALLHAFASGDRSAFDRLFENVYGELRRIARRQLRAAPPLETLETTALVHEAYLKLSGGATWSTQDRFHFYALAAQAMRRVLIDHARRRTRLKRGGRAVDLPLADADLAVAARGEELIALDRALERLEAVDADLAQLVEWRFFAGLAVDEIAELRGVTDRTIKRHWRLARAFLLREMSAPEPVP
jgi:RNA polymerase sigma factor (TIGR02999 family)